MLFIFINCANGQPFQKEVAGFDSTKGLKDYYKNYFTMGVAVSSPGIIKSGEATLIRQQFESITPGNAMKMRPIHPKENEYSWKDADSIQ